MVGLRIRVNSETQAALGAHPQKQARLVLEEWARRHPAKKWVRRTQFADGDFIEIDQCGITLASVEPRHGSSVPSVGDGTTSTERPQRGQRHPLPGAAVALWQEAPRAPGRFGRRERGPATLPVRGHAPEGRTEVRPAAFTRGHR
jgi:hypothetical protein